MTNFKPKLIVFDLDGTLVDSSPDIASAVNQMLAELNLANYAEQQIRNWMGCGATMLLKRALTGELEPATEPDNLQQAMQIFSKYYGANVCNASQLYPGVTQGLQRFKAVGMHLACVTNKPAQFTQPLLAQMGIADYFQFIASGDTFQRMKPDPLPLLEAAKAVDVASDDALMVGDSVSDIQAGRNAGFKTALVPYGYIGRYRHAELGADYQIESIQHLAELLC